MHLHPQKILKTLTSGIVIYYLTNVVSKIFQVHWGTSLLKTWNRTNHPHPSQGLSPTHPNLRRTGSSQLFATTIKVQRRIGFHATPSLGPRLLANWGGWHMVLDEKNSIICRKGSKYNIQEKPLVRSMYYTRKGACNFLKSTTTILESWKIWVILKKKHRWNWIGG